MSPERFGSATARRLSVVVAVLLSLGLVAGIGSYLARTTSAARTEVITDYQSRAETSARLIAGTLAASDEKTRATGEASFTGDVAELRSQIGRQHVGAPWYVVLGADGRPLLTDPPSRQPTTRDLASDAGFRIARETGRLAFGTVRPGPDGPYTPAFQPFDAPGGTRMLVLPVALSDLGTILAGALDGTSSTSYLIDHNGMVVVSSQAGVAGSVLADTALLTAAGRHADGVRGDLYYAARPVAGSDWRVLLTTSNAKLLAPVQATARVAWQMFAAFALAMMVIVLIGYVVVRGSVRLAQARLHDALTGLPNRALFLERAGAAVAEWRRKRQNGGTDLIAALFLDLDGFKPVNDTYGHAAGDELLRQVALRLVDATRPEDLVCRFGGDEFLVLCRKVRDQEGTVAVANRIQEYLTEPFLIDGHPVRIGVSIGIATFDERVPELAALINRADLALYRAKERGRNRVEIFDGSLAH